MQAAEIDLEAQEIINISEISKDIYLNLIPHEEQGCLTTLQSIFLPFSTNFEESKLDSEYCVNAPRSVNLELSTLAGHPKNIWAMFFHSKSLQIYERYCLYEMIKRNDSFECFLEILAKAIVYREPELHSIIPFPGGYKNSHYHIEYVIKTGVGFTAYHLKSCNINYSDKYPEIFVICGSNFHLSGLDSSSTVIRDFSSKIGEFSVDIFENIYFGKSKLFIDSDCILLGHSLGGAIAQHLMLSYPMLFKRLVTFNSPGIIVDTNQQEEFEDNCKSYETEITIYQTYGDIVQAVGGTHLGLNSSNVTEFSYTNFIVNDYWTNDHTYLCLQNPSNLEIKCESYNNWDLPRLKNFEKITKLQVNHYLDNKFRNFMEILRLCFALIIFPLSICLRCCSRRFYDSRVKSNKHYLYNK